MNYPTSDRARILFDYDPDVGVFVWRWRPRFEFRHERDWKAFLSRYSGRIAGHLCTDGYWYITVDRCRIGAHRVAWMYCYGEEPNHVDHINGDTSDNRIANLRSVTPMENARNQARRVNNKTGTTGVCWAKDEEKWSAYINTGGRQVRIGYFRDFEEAVEARKAAEEEHGYHPNHGRSSL